MTILTTHVGSLPRSKQLSDLLFKKENPTSNQKKFAKRIIKETPKQKSDRGATAVMRHCREKYLNK